MIESGRRLDALRELQRPEGHPAPKTHEEWLRDVILELIARSSIQDGELRGALEALHEIRSAQMRIGLLIDLANAVDR